MNHDKGNKCTLSKFDTNLSDAVDASEEEDGIQRNLNKFEKWAMGTSLK